MERLSQKTGGAEGSAEQYSPTDGGGQHGADQRRHELVVSLLSMLQAPSASVLIPKFEDRNG